MAMALRSRRASAEAIERELRVVRGAIDLVALGVAPRVSVAGLGCGAELVTSARRLALAAGVRVVVRRAEDRVAGLEIEAFGDD